MTSTVPQAPQQKAASRIPWKTIGGACLWALGMILQMVLPKAPPGIPVAMQGLGVGLGTVGAVSATADLAAASPFLRFATNKLGGALNVGLMLIGGVYYAATRFLSLIMPAGMQTTLAVTGTLSILGAIVGWRLWLHHIVKQSWTGTAA